MNYYKPLNTYLVKCSYPALADDTVIISNYRDPALADSVLQFIGARTDFFQVMCSLQHA